MLFHEAGHMLNMNEHDLGMSNLHFQGCAILSIIYRMVELTTKVLSQYLWYN